jgi:hypothetical protein
VNQKDSVRKEFEDFERQKEFTRLHYRKFYRDELENCKSIFRKPIFENIDIMRGANRGVSKQHFSHNAKDESGEFSKRKKVGLFKGLISVWNTEDNVKK